MKNKLQSLKLFFFVLIYINIILSIWVLLNYFKEKNNFILEMTELNFSNIFPESLAITAAILSLMGLIAIFISLNTQHNIQRCRELYWEMVDTKHKFKSDNVAIANELRRLINNYSVAFNPGTNYIGRIIFIAQVTIWFVILTWTTIFVLNYWPKYSLSKLNFNSIWSFLSDLNFNIICILLILSVANSILFYFANIIKDLNSIKKVDDRLQEPNNFYDVENKNGIPITPLIANELDFSIELDKEQQSKENIFNLFIKLGHGNPINNFEVIIKKIRLDFFDPLNPTRGNILLEEKIDKKLIIKYKSQNTKSNFNFSDSLNYVIDFNKFRSKPLASFRNIEELNYKFILFGYVQHKDSIDFNQRIFFTVDNLILSGLNTKESSQAPSRLLTFKKWRTEYYMINLRSNHSKYDDDFEEAIFE
ncbi:hypothetical protein P8610_12890 [Fictibacillus sp. UD]|uniref:hypothetical protein n=1 Tax=Fictibacillus sp. UD TaxID=3038777 RepID=UPI003747440A